jgi:hypothetical protein
MIVIHYGQPTDRWTRIDIHINHVMNRGKKKNEAASRFYGLSFTSSISHVKLLTRGMAIHRQTTDGHQNTSYGKSL